MSSDIDVDEESRSWHDASDHAPTADPTDPPTSTEIVDEEAALTAPDHILNAVAATTVGNNMTGNVRFTEEPAATFKHVSNDRSSFDDDVIDIIEAEPEAYFMEEEGTLDRVSGDRSSLEEVFNIDEAQYESYYEEEEGVLDHVNRDPSSPVEDLVNIDEAEAQEYYVEEEDAIYHAPKRITGNGSLITVAKASSHHSSGKPTGKTIGTTVKQARKPSRKPIKKSVAKPVSNQNQGLNVSLHNPKLDRLYPQDSYSMIADNGPQPNGTWPRQKKIFLLLGLIPYCFQVAFLWLLILSHTWVIRGTVGEIDNPFSQEGMFLQSFIPAGVPRITRYTQILSLISYVVFPDEGLKDIVTAVQSFPRPSKVQSGERVETMQIACILRLAQGVSAMIATLVLIITSHAVVDIILNFTAISFISNLDNYAFQLASRGEFGPTLQAETERIANKKLPRCMHRSRIPKYVYNNWVKMILLVILMTISAYIIFAQNTFWTTSTLRVQFDESSGFREYSGCYNVDKDSVYFLRNTYHADNQDLNASFGYCRNSRQWLLYDGESNTDPCLAQELARSEQTDFFDISSTFFTEWASATNAPVELYFFEEGKGREAYFCDLELGDGICDHDLNERGFRYDEGDCCAGTCIGSKCGYGGLESVFGNSKSSGDGFPNCRDPDMVSLTIKLNSIISSRDGEIPGIDDLDDDWFYNNRIDENEFRNATPVNPYLSLDCNDKNVLTVTSVYVDETMVNNSETVSVLDGADCTLVVRSQTVSDPKVDDPVWYINYTLYNGEKAYVENENVEILTQSSEELEMRNFTMIPKCYFTKLKHDVDVATIYTASEPSNIAIDWLLNDKTGNSDCEDEFFIERYALLTVFLAINAPGQFMNRDKHCKWQSILCSSGTVNKIELQGAKIEENIPSEIGLLQSVDEIDLCKYSYFHVPTLLLLKA